MTSEPHSVRSHAVGLHSAGSATPAAAGNRRIAVVRLDLNTFRNYSNLTLAVGPEPVVLIGPNGAGKTNLLEAISLLVPGRGLRRAALTDLTNSHGAGGAGRVGQAGGGFDAHPPGWAVSARMADGRQLGTGLGPGGRRIARIDGETRRVAALAEELSVLWLVPEMDRLFQDTAAGRRFFFDRLVYGLDPRHAARLSAYDLARRERMRLLATGRADARWLLALENQLAALGVAIAAARRDLVERLGRSLSRVGDGLPALALHLEGEVETWLDTMPAVDVEDRLRAVWTASRAEDSAAGRMLRGPHRTDVAVTLLRNRQLIGRCSTGEQKIALIKLLLAHTALLIRDQGRLPVLLFDEVTAHLDGTHRGLLFRRLLEMGVQAWMTGTEVGVFRELSGRAQFLTVADAAIT